MIDLMSGLATAYAQGTQRQRDLAVRKYVNANRRLAANRTFKCGPWTWRTYLVPSLGDVCLRAKR